MKTPYQIAQECEELNGQRNIAAINRAFRAQDESHKWPICGRFNATERAIRKLRGVRRECVIDPGLEYALALDSMVSEIVNGEN